MDESSATFFLNFYKTHLLDELLPAQQPAGKLLDKTKQVGCNILQNIESQNEANHPKEVYVVTQIFWLYLVFLLVPIPSICTFCTLGQMQSSPLTGDSEYETLWLQKTLGLEICQFLPFIHDITGCSTTSRLLGLEKEKFRKGMN